MSQKLESLKWQSVPVEGFPVSITDNFQGFIGLEECTSYGLEKDNKKPKKIKENKRKHQTTVIIENKIPTKKAKVNNQHNKIVMLSNGFIVESCNKVTPSLTNELSKINIEDKRNENTDEKKIKQEVKKDKIKIKGELKVNKRKKPKLGEKTTDTVSELTPEDMLTWAEFKLQPEIMKALTELGFKKPTKIQQLSLPAAIHGRRDILGAAETGSGKTLAFGLPIISGIIKLKEKADLKGLDVYDIPYKKTSIKRKKQEPEVVKKKDKSKSWKETKKTEQKAKDSSEEGYSSGDDEVTKKEDNVNKEIESEDSDEEYLEEIEVPVRKRNTSDDEGNNSDESDNYVHLSETFDSDDLADSSDDNEDVVSRDDDSEAENNSDEETDSQDEVNEIGEGIGCVKVIDNMDVPNPVVVKTGKLLYALILTPTRELAIQISRHLIAVAKYTGIRIATIVGGMAAVKQERVLRSGPEVVVATPGRLWELYTQGHPHLQQLHTVKFLAIDETDRMVERNHFEELQPLLERLNADPEKSSTRQNFVFSATLTMVHDLPSHMLGKKVTKRGKIVNRKIEKMTSQQKIQRLIKMIGMTEPKVVDITSQNLGAAETLTECRITCALEMKDVYLYYILRRHPGRTIVFCNSIGCVQRLATLLTILKCNPLPLHANMQQRQRLRNLERLRDDPRAVLVATDVAARGLDIPDVDHVIHYQVPRTAENYVHRSGRTARADKEGLTILMMDPSEAYLYGKLCRTLNKVSELPTFPVPSHVLTPMKDIVNVAREIDGLQLKDRRVAQARGWREKAARDMDIIIDDDDVPVQEVDPTVTRALKSKRSQLNALLSRPLFPKGFSFKYPTLNDFNVLNDTDENALEVMKKAIESGEVKKKKRVSKNAALLNLGKIFKKK